MCSSYMARNTPMWPRPPHRSFPKSPRWFDAADDAFAEDPSTIIL